MKTTTAFKLYIAYRREEWHPLNRQSELLSAAMHIAEEIQKVHKPTTKIAVVKETMILDTSCIYKGTNTILKPKQYTKCKQCNIRRKNKNINPKTGICLVCELRNTVNAQQPELV